MIQANLFLRPNDPDNERILSNLASLQIDYPHQLQVIDIEQEPILEDEYGDKAPVLDVGLYRLVKSFDLPEIKLAFSKAQERLEKAKAKGNDVMVRRITEPIKMTKSDRFSRWFSKHYMLVLNLFTFLYVFLAFLAPTFMKIGWETPAKGIYRIYSPLCHQLAFRSFFIFGEQAYYPRELAGVEGVVTYGQATGFNEYDIPTARNFLGNNTLGYKLALCQRDIAIYTAIVLFGFIFSLTGKRIKPLPWLLWIIIGLGPIGLDGFSQLLSQINLAIFNWLPLRESTPFLRTLTGALFGLATAWFGYPYLEESTRENRRELQLKYAIVRQTSVAKDG